MNNKYRFLGVFLFAVLLVTACGRKPNVNTSLKTESDSASYFFGYHLGIQLAQVDIENFSDLNFNAIARGINEALQNGKEFDQDKIFELQMFLTSYVSKLQARSNEKFLIEGQQFLEANQRKPGVVTLPSGLQYRIIRDGSGARPTRNDMAELLYHGTFADGTVFESSKERNDTVTFFVGQMIEGFTEALTLMNEGSIWEIFIPYYLAYGEEGNHGIPPFSTLIFELDLVRVVRFDMDE